MATAPSHRDLLTFKNSCSHANTVKVVKKKYFGQVEVTVAFQNIGGWREG